MNTTLRMLLGFALSAWLLPGTALAQKKVTYDYAHTQDFSQLKTYAFRDATKTDNPLVDARIVANITEELAAKGLTRDDAHPDVYVSARQTFETHQVYTAYSDGPWGWGWGYYGAGYRYYGPGWGYYGAGWGGYTTGEVRNVTVRTLTVDLTDASTNALVWRGVGQRTVRPLSKPSHVSKRIDHEVSDIFDNFPPRH